MGRRQLRATTAIGAVHGEVMPGNNWLADRHTEVAAESILDAAAALFRQQPAASVGMHEIASAAGCSRATLYRYFPNRNALHTAYVHREAYAVAARLVERVGTIADPRRRTVEWLLTALDLVRGSPSLQSWFVSDQPPIGAEIADSSDVIQRMCAGFVSSLQPDSDEPADSVERKARWLVRVLTSLLTFPGRDADDERAMIEDFVVPILVTRQSVR